MTADEELTTWRAEWQSLGGKEGFGKELVERAAKDARKMKRSAAGEVLGALSSSAVCVGLVVKMHGAAEVTAVTAMILLFNGAWLTHFFTVRAGTFSPEANGLDAFVELTRKRIATAIRWNRYAANWTAILSLLLVPWSVWTFLAHKEAYLAAPWRAFVGFGGWVGIMAALLVFLRWKRAKLVLEQERFEKQVAEVSLT